MICYQRTDGIAHDIRFVAEDYATQPGELLVAGDELPSMQALSDPAAWSAKSDAETAEAASSAAKDGLIAGTSIGVTQPATPAQLKAMSAAQYSTWFDANFDTAAKCIALLKALVRIVIRRVL